MVIRAVALSRLVTSIQRVCMGKLSINPLFVCWHRFVQVRPTRHLSVLLV